MNKKITKLIDRFDVITETGIVFTIFKHQDFDVAEAFQEEPQEIPGRMWFSTLDGKGVNQIDENTYKLLNGTDIIMTKKI